MNLETIDGIEMSEELKFYCESMQEVERESERLLAQDKISEGDFYCYRLAMLAGKNGVITIAKRKKYYLPLLVALYQNQIDFGKKIREKYQRDNPEGEQ